MSIPAGVETVVVNITPPDGVSADSVDISVRPTVSLKWEETDDHLDTIITYSGKFAVLLPAVDQDGFVTMSGDPFHNWQYVVTFTGKINGVQFSVSNLHQVYVGDNILDLQVLAQPQNPINGPMSAVTKGYVDTTVQNLSNQSNLALAISVALS